MSVLVTGAAGFVGRHVVKSLIDSDAHVIATDRVDRTKLNDECLYDVTYIGRDLYNGSWKDVVDTLEINKVIHLAWSGLPNYSSMHHIEDNLFDNYHFLSHLIDCGVRDITVAGTCAEYGRIEGCVSEDMGTRPVTPYAIAKDSLRKFLEAKLLTVAFNLKWVRLFYLYGEGQSHSSVLSQLDIAVGKGLDSFDMSGGEQLRDYINVGRASGYLSKICIQDKVDGIINCCSGSPISIRKLVERRIKEKEYDISLNLGRYGYSKHEPMAFWGDNRKLRKILLGE